MIWSVFNYVVKDGNSFLSQWFNISTVAVVWVLWGTQNWHVLCQNILNDILSRSSVSKTNQFCAAQIAFECSDVLIDFTQMSFKILCSPVSVTTWLLPAPCNKSQGSSWSQSCFFEHSESFKDSDESSTVIVSASLWSCVPWVNVASCKNYLVRLFRTLDFKDYVVWVRVWNKLSLND